MNPHAILVPVWTTSSLSPLVRPFPVESTALGSHMHTCRGLRGRLFTLHCTQSGWPGFVAARFVTTLMVVMLLMGIVLLVF